MKQILFATTNKGKVHSVSRVLLPLGIKVIQADIEVPEPRSDDLEVIAKHKTEAAFRSLREPVIAVDSGFFIKALNGFPRAFVNFALETIGLDGILKLVEGKPRECEFRDCSAYFDGSELKVFQSCVAGHIAPEPRGALPAYAWSVLWQIFIPEGKEKTLAEMSEAEVSEWREHRRGSSFAQQFGQWFKTQCSS